MKYIFLFLGLFLTITSCKSQIDSEALDLVTKFFDNELEDHISVLIGEAKEQGFNPSEIEKKVKKTYEILSEEKDKAVIAITLYRKKKHLDIYAFLVKDEVWKIKAFRSVSFPGFFYTMLEEYKGLDKAGLEQKYKDKKEAAQQKDDTLSKSEIIAEIGTLEAFVTKIENMKLMTSSDEKLTEHFKENKEHFENTLELILNDTTIINSDNWRINKEHLQFKTALNKILILSISGDRGNDLIDFVIGGMIDNSVGYFYCENSKKLPEITDNRYIMIKKIAEGWYMYKTT